MTELFDRRVALGALTSSAVFGVTKIDGGKKQGEPHSELGSIDPRQFGAKYDGVSDDSEALQKAIMACASPRGWADLIISGPMKIDKPVVIDRTVDKTIGIFQIQGSGRGEIIIGSDYVFDSNIDYAIHPVSEGIRIKNLSILGESGYLFSRKFLRIQIYECYFSGTGIIFSENYVQSVEVFGTKFIRRNKNPLISCKDAYDIHFKYCHFENSGKILYINGSANCISMVSCVIESCSLETISINSINSFTFMSNYTENNEGNTIYLGYLEGKSRSIYICGNNFKRNNNKSEIYLGRAEGVVSIANYCSGNLYDTGFIKNGDILSLSDIILGELYSTKLNFTRLNLDSHKSKGEIDLRSVKSEEKTVLNDDINIIIDANGENNIVYLPLSIEYKYRKMLIINETKFSIAVSANENGKIIHNGQKNMVILGSFCSLNVVEYFDNRWCVE